MGPIEPARINGDTVLATGPRLDPKSHPCKHRPELPAVLTLGRVEPDDQDARRTQEVHEPVERGREGFDRGQLPLNETNIVLAARKAASRRCRHANKATAMQLEHSVGSARARQDNSIELGTARKLDQRLDFEIATRILIGSFHDGHHRIIQLVRAARALKAQSDRLNESPDGYFRFGP